MGDTAVCDLSGGLGDVGLRRGQRSGSAACTGCVVRGDVQLRMAARGHHRAAGVIDLLTAAVAEHHGAVILYYAADFEHIAATTGQPHAWIAPRGTLS